MISKVESLHCTTRQSIGVDQEHCTRISLFVQWPTASFWSCAAWLKHWSFS